MKSKRNIYILLPIALLLWGYFAFKLINGLKKQEVNYKKDIYLNDTTKLNDNQDSVLLSLKYMDPFLKNVGIVNKSQTKTNNEKKKTTTNRSSKLRNRKNEPKWPLISFGGVISNENKGEELGLLQINNKNYLLSLGEESNGVELVKLFEDSVVLRFNNMEKTFEKNKK